MTDQELQELAARLLHHSLVQADYDFDALTPFERLIIHKKGSNDQARLNGLRAWIRRRLLEYQDSK